MKLEMMKLKEDETKMVDAKDAKDVEVDSRNAEKEKEIVTEEAAQKVDAAQREMKELTDEGVSLSRESKSELDAHSD